MAWVDGGPMPKYIDRFGGAAVVRLDRELQRTILAALRNAYPNSIEISVLKCSIHEHYQANLAYLEEKGLVEGSHEMGRFSPFVLARITAEGLDFLEDDGGVDAIRATD